MEKVIQYKTSDGATFDSQEQAQAHQAILSVSVLVDEYIQTLRPAEGATRGEARRASRIRSDVLAWEKWRAGR